MIDLRLFETVEEYERARTMEYSEPWTSLIDSIERVDYNMTEEEKKRREMTKTPLTFEITTAGNIRWKTSNTNHKRTIQYKKNNGNWTSITASTTAGTTFTVAVGDIIQLRGDNDSYAASSSYYTSFSASTAGFKAYGNIMSLINSTDFVSLTSLETLNMFPKLFNHCTGLTDASNLMLPATTLFQNCYQYLFSGCTSLVTPPELPATTLANYCYQGMFYYCTNLTAAPELPATTLNTSCYNSMFQGCTSLATAPELPTTTLAGSCYQNMFSGCTSLNYIKCLATNISASNCTANWLSGVASSGTFVKAAGISESTWGRGESGIPTNWTVEDA